MKLALGTVQFGLDYGAFGSKKRVAQGEVRSILKAARAAGIDTIDTARAYGEAESVLASTGELSHFDVVTKCPKLPADCDPAAVLFEEFSASCDALQVDSVSGYLLHDAADLDRPGVLGALGELVQSGRAEYIGVSVYSYKEALELCDKFPLNLIQLPANVLDPWYKNSEFPPNVNVHVRSVFLQGFLLSDPDSLPVFFHNWKDTLKTFRQRAEFKNLTPVQAALLPIVQSPAIDRVVVGVDSLLQFQDIIDFQAKLGDLELQDLGEYPDATEMLTDPRKWQ